jgi:hypothetical protein
METNPSNKGKKRLLIGLGLLATGVLSFFGYQYWNSNKKRTETSDNNADDKAEKPKTTKPPLNKHKKTPPKKPSAKPKTPIKKEPIKTVTETVSVMKEKVADPSVVAKGLYASIKLKSFSAALRILKTIKSPLRYAEIGRHFNNYRIGGIRQTIVNAMLTTFKSEEQKKVLNDAFTTIGLKYDGKKWSLEGLGARRMIITTRPTKVWKDPRTSVQVPENMVLGKEIAKRKEHTLFENDKQYFLVKSTDVGIFKN